MKRNALEWLVLIASLLAVVGLVGFLLVDGLADSSEPPPSAWSSSTRAPPVRTAGWSR